MRESTAGKGDIKDQISNLNRALQINEESKIQAKKLLERHSKYFNFEQNRFQQLINEIDQIIDNCDK